MPFEVDLVRVLGVYWSSIASDVFCIFAWQILCMVFSSMRFDDALHVAPSSIVWRDSVLILKAWQTKVERKRKMTTYAVGNASFTEFSWLEAGFTKYWNFLGEMGQLPDFWLCTVDLSQDVLSPTCPAEPAYWLTLMKSVCKEAMSLFAAASTMTALRTNVATLTLHSCRATLLNALALRGAEHTTLMLQGNWKNADMPAKYTRDRKAIPLAFIRKMAVEFDEEVPEPGWLLSILGSPTLSIAPTTRTLTGSSTFSERRVISPRGRPRGCLSWFRLWLRGSRGRRTPGVHVARKVVPLRTLPEALSGTGVFVWGTQRPDVHSSKNLIQKIHPLVCHDRPRSGRGHVHDRPKSGAQAG